MGGSCRGNIHIENHGDIYELEKMLKNIEHGSVNVPIEHHPTIRYMVYNGYYKVMSNIPKMGHLLTPVEHDLHPAKDNVI